MKRYILTGTPGSGKTSIIHTLEGKGYDVIHEAATDIIAHEQLSGNKEPWKYPEFIDAIVCLQKQRQVEALGALQFYDRSPICTYALCIYLGFTPSTELMNEIERMEQNNIYNRLVFFLENLGFITNTDARKISFEEAVKFEKIHKDSYAKFQYNGIMIGAGSIEQRVEFILKNI